MPDQVIDVAEIPNGNGGVRFRIARYFSADGSRWVRHGTFVMYHDNGAIATEGNYRDGLEHGNWRYFYEHGQLAAEGCYYSGKEEGYWFYWTRDGIEQLPVEYEAGVIVSPDPNGVTVGSQG